MMAKRKRPSGPSRTIQRLRRRLQEAEDTIAAIREGHVEALVVRAGEGEQIFTLRSADQPYRLMVEQMREGALTLAADGTVLYCNRRFAELVASPAERIAGGPLQDFIEPADRPIAKAMLEAEAYRGELRLRTSDGTSTATQVSSIALTIDEGRTIAVVVTDLSHERIERGLRESNRLKDEFLATLSHELRTPLNVILGWTRMLMADVLPDDARRRALQLIDRNAQAQAQLVNDLVDMSRMSTGKLRLEVQAVPLVPAIDAAIESVRPAATGKELEVATSFDADDVNVLADPTRLQQILWNLLSNSVKFTPSGGRILVSATRMDHAARIEVSDSGIGIDPAFLPHVFDRFRQADSGTTRGYGGLGLGLAIVHDLVRLHGGDVQVRSEGAGRGATFSVILPTTTAPVRPMERRQRTRDASSLAGLTVMLVEDHDDSRELFVKTLEGAGASIAAFESAGDAFAACERVRPSVIIADIGLRGEDGYSFVRRVRAHPMAAIRSVPAIAVTAYASASDRAEALAAGFQQHLAKPIVHDQLIEAIHQLAHRR